MPYSKREMVILEVKDVSHEILFRLMENLRQHMITPERYYYDLSGNGEGCSYSGIFNKSCNQKIENLLAELEIGAETKLEEPSKKIS